MSWQRISTSMYGSGPHRIRLYANDDGAWRWEVWARGKRLASAMQESARAARVEAEQWIDAREAA